jgi:hypothetical protein
MKRTVCPLRVLHSTKWYTCFIPRLLCLLPTYRAAVQINNHLIGMDIRRSLAQPRQSVFSAAGAVVPLNEGPASHLNYLQATVQMTAKCSATVSTPSEFVTCTTLKTFDHALSIPGWFWNFVRKRSWLRYVKTSALMVHTTSNA